MRCFAVNIYLSAIQKVKLTMRKVAPSRMAFTFGSMSMGTGAVCVWLECGGSVCLMCGYGCGGWECVGMSVVGGRVWGVW